MKTLCDYSSYFRAVDLDQVRRIRRLDGLDGGDVFELDPPASSSPDVDVISYIHLVEIRRRIAE